LRITYFYLRRVGKYRNTKPGTNNPPTLANIFKPVMKQLYFGLFPQYWQL
jgi:hypothetical protein